jgi:8-oxo-dGTP pyrophosphatase MutT (NUDIX family)
MKQLKRGKRKSIARERSAGVLLFREDPHEGRLFLLLDYGRYWDYPKGHVEKGEDDHAAAVRELEEETGITDARFLPGFAHEIVYFFRHPKKGTVRKSVLFFLARTTSDKVRISDEHEDYSWVKEDQVLARVKYPTAKQVFAAAREFLK